MQQKLKKKNSKLMITVFFVPSNYLVKIKTHNLLSKKLLSKEANRSNFMSIVYFDLINFTCTCHRTGSAFKFQK